MTPPTIDTIYHLSPGDSTLGCTTEILTYQPDLTHIILAVLSMSCHIRVPMCNIDVNHRARDSMKQNTAAAVAVVSKVIFMPRLGLFLTL